MIFNYLVTVFLFLSCTAYIGGQQFGVTQAFVYKIGIPALWLVSLCMKPKRQAVNLWLNACVGFAFITLFFLKGDALHVAIDPIIHVFLALILFYTLANHLPDIKPILNGLCWVVGFQAVISLLQGTGLDPVCVRETGTHNTHFVGFYGFKFLYGLYMALATPILLFNKRYFFGALSFVMCILSLCVASVGLMFVALLFGVFVYKPKLIVPCIIAAAIVGAGAWVFVISGHTQTIAHKLGMRFILETKFLPIIFQKPLFGFGLGSFKYIGPNVWNVHAANPAMAVYGTMTDGWNDYLERSIEMGLPIIVLMCGLFWNEVKRFMRVVKTAEVVGVFSSLAIIPFSILFQSYFNHASVSILMITLLAGFYICVDFS